LIDIIFHLLTAHTMMRSQVLCLFLKRTLLEQVLSMI
jgi:hypothetical protein